jgi:hypothetical protein
MIDHAIMLDVSVESGNHRLTGSPSTKGRLKAAFLNGNTSIFSRSISIFIAQFQGGKLA